MALNELTARLFRGLGDRYVVARYEDIVGDPGRELARIADRLGLGGGLAMTDSHTVEVRRNHTSWGNGMRFVTGPLELRVDDQWVNRARGGRPAPGREDHVIHKAPVLLLTTRVMTTFLSSGPGTEAGGAVAA